MQETLTTFNKDDYQTQLAPVAPWNSGKPVINGPDVYGASPGKDFLYLIPTVGERPVSFSAQNLPSGLMVETGSGHIKGRAEKAGEYMVTLKAENRHGKCSRTLKLVIENNALALTPPMGWNSWNCYRSDIEDTKIKVIADSMISSGLVARGYSYVNLDSGWQSKTRGGKFNSIVPNDGFPDMKALCDHIHSLGLKAGIYSGPFVKPWGTEGCGTTSGICDTNFAPCFIQNFKYIGVDKYEQEDVNQWAEWGFDYFKYDWCPTDMILTERMSRELRKSSRDIIFSICTRVDIKDAFKVKDLVNLWRCNADTEPGWNSILNNGFSNQQLNPVIVPGHVNNQQWNPAIGPGHGINNQQWNPVIGPGHWFDLDMTVINPRAGSSLTQNELIAHLSCWIMRPSPIMIDCDPSEMDDFTLRLLCNEEIIAVNQDSLGKPAANMFQSNSWVTQLKPLADGNYALALFNLGNEPGIAPRDNFGAFFEPERKYPIRDLWARKDIGNFDRDSLIGIDAHCAKVFKIFMH